MTEQKRGGCRPHIQTWAREQCGKRVSADVAVAEQLENYVVSEPTDRAVPGAYTLKLRGHGRELVIENIEFK